ncbi:MAG: dihydroneopterin aldolase [Bacteroidales bacterium]
MKEGEKNILELVNMEFYAYHGCFREEQIIGNKFTVTLTIETDLSVPAESDELSDAVNYQELYKLVRREMEITSKLLENVANRITSSIHKSFPEIKKITVSISKLNPPVGGKVEASRVVLSKSF